MKVTVKAKPTHTWHVSIEVTTPKGTEREAAEVRAGADIGDIMDARDADATMDRLTDALEGRIPESDEVRGLKIEVKRLT